MRKNALSILGPLAIALTSRIARSDEIVRVPAAAAVRQELLITSQDVALVTETRRANLPPGRLDLYWEGAPPTSRTETWSLSGPREVRWLGLESSAAPRGSSSSADWLKPLVGKRVRVIRPGGAAVDADVLEVHGPTPDLVLFREGANLVYGEPQASLVAPADTARGERPGGIYLKVSHASAGTRDLTARYLLGGVSWEADYALTLSADEKSALLEGWFVVDNGCGSELAAARLRLLAGNLRVAGETQPRAMAATSAQAEPSVAGSTAVSESRVYEIASPGRLREGRTTFPLAEKEPVSISKRYLVRPSFWPVSGSEAQRLPVAVQYRIATKALNKALPAGIVRVYAEQGAFYAGEARIAHAPEGTDVDIETSEAFDLVARRRQTAFAQVGPHETESTVEITVASAKKESVTVLVQASFAGEWTLLDSSVPPARRDAFTAEFALPVPAGSTAKLTYRVRVRAAG